MADRMKDHIASTGVKDGYNNSEHELEVSGMRHAPDDRKRRRDGYSKAEIDEDVHISKLTVNELSPLEKKQEEEVEGGHIHRGHGAEALHGEMDRAASSKQDEASKQDGASNDDAASKRGDGTNR